jgi:uncharacterized protein RhaS with RHS repeats
LGHRFYWPELGRFIQQDPIGDDINWYTYAANNPLVSIDPEGTSVKAFAKCVWMETYGNDINAVYNWARSRFTNQPAPLTRGVARSGGNLAWAATTPSGYAAGRAGDTIGRAARGAHARGARARGIQVAYRYLQETGGRHAEPNIGFVGNKVTRGWSDIGRRSFRRGAKLHKAATWLGRGARVLKWAGKLNTYYTVVQGGYAAYKCRKKW